MRMPRHVLCLAVLAALAPGSATPQSRTSLPERAAEGFRYAAELSLAHSDNRERLNPKGPSDTLFAPRLGFTWFHAGSRLESRVIGELEYLHSLRDRFGDESRTRLSAQVDWALAPQRLYWTFQDYAAVEPVNVRAPRAPSNLQQTNVLVTGPSLWIKPEGLFSGQLEARYANSYAEVNKTFEGDRVMAAARAFYGSEARRRLGLGIEETRVRYDIASTLHDHDRQDIVLQLVGESARLDYSARIGRSRIDFLDGDRPSAGLAQLGIGWRPDDDNLFRVDVLRELSDAARDFTFQLQRNELPRDLRGHPQLGAELYRIRSAQVAWRRRGPHWEWSIDPYYRDYEYLRRDATLDNRARGGSVDGTYVINPVLSISGRLAVEQRSFRVDSRRDRTHDLGVSLERRFSRRWAVRVGFDHSIRDSNVPRADYEENVVSVALIFRGGRG